MSFLSEIYNNFLWLPLFNGLVLFYNLLPWKDLGLAIVAFTVFIRLILTPFLIKARKSQREMSLVQPEIKKIQEKFKGNREAQNKALMELYAKYKINPFSGCLLLLIQLPILIAIFDVFSRGLGEIQAKNLYSFVNNPGVLQPISFGVLDLSKGNIYLGVLAALTQYWQTKMSTDLQPQTAEEGPSFAKTLRWQSLYFFPILVLFWSYTLPAALTLYWTVLNILGIVQEIIWKPKDIYGHGSHQTGN